MPDIAQRSSKASIMNGTKPCIFKKDKLILFAGQLRAIAKIVINHVRTSKTSFRTKGRSSSPCKRGWIETRERLFYRQGAHPATHAERRRIPRRRGSRRISRRISLQAWRRYHEEGTRTCRERWQKEGHWWRYLRGGEAKDVLKHFFFFHSNRIW